ncbi:hypothetical protein DIE03_06075 [Burkholderia sp. Bp8992]|nr:hypothetical protein DIE03_06075 [Burkholderia sp. Bp8992]
MPAGAAHVPQGLHLCGSSSTGTILYIHTVFHDDPADVMGRRPAKGRQGNQRKKSSRMPNV